MLEGVSLQIAQVLIQKAKGKSRTTYENVAQEIGWPHPTGRGLGKYLHEIMHYCKQRTLPPLTLIVVRKGTKEPSYEASAHIKAALGDIDFEVKQNEVLDFDWNVACEFIPPKTAQLPDGRHIWLTSFWGFNPDSWGCIGFSSEAKQNYFLRRTRPGVIVAIYVTKGKGRLEERGKVVGFLEISHEAGHAKNFISGDQWALKEKDPESRGKWSYALRATRAWRVIEEEQQIVDDLLPKTYAGSHPEFIGSQGVPVTDADAEKLLSLTVYEVPVYGQTDQIQSGMQNFKNALKPSSAVYPATEPYWVAEVDGPKHLYILRLTGNLENYLGRTTKELEDQMIIKVGFSKSPMTRRDQIQAAYPDGKYKWEVLYPTEISSEPPYPNADIAIAGEDAMKARLVKDGGLPLGREFYLADAGLVIRTWHAGMFGAAERMKAKDSIGAERLRIVEMKI